jgi:hypothetical protein
MRHLAAIVKNINTWRSFTKQPKIDIDNITFDDWHVIRNDLEARLSPENLTGDGELPQAEVERRRTFYTAALRELESLRETA